MQNAGVRPHTRVRRYDRRAAAPRPAYAGTPTRCSRTSASGSAIRWREQLEVRKATAGAFQRCRRRFSTASAHRVLEPVVSRDFRCQAEADRTRRLAPRAVPLRYPAGAVSPLSRITRRPASTCGAHLIISGKESREADAVAAAGGARGTSILPGRRRTAPGSGPGGRTTLLWFRKPVEPAARAAPATTLRHRLSSAALAPKPEDSGSWSQADATNSYRIRNKLSINSGALPLKVHPVGLAGALT